MQESLAPIKFLKLNDFKTCHHYTGYCSHTQTLTIQMHDMYWYISHVLVGSRTWMTGGLMSSR